MPLKRLALLAITILAITIPPAQARFDKIPGSRYTTARAAALGDAYLNFANDGADALFYNPSAFGKLRGAHFEALNFSGGVDQNFASSIGINSWRIISLPQFQPYMTEGKIFGARGHLFPNFYTRGFGIGVYAARTVQASYTGSEMTYRSLYHLIPAAGFGFKLASGILRIGYSLQWVNQASGSNTTDFQANGTPQYYDNLAQGSGFSHTAGATITMPIRFLPQFNFVVRNAAGMTFSSFAPVSQTPSSTGTPAAEEMTLDGSAGGTIRFARGASVQFAAQLRDITGKSGFSLIKRASAGFEFNFRDVLFLRGGYRGGYFSAGVGLQHKSAEFGLSWFTEEIGTPDASQPDTNFLVQYQIRVF